MRMNNNIQGRTQTLIKDQTSEQIDFVDFDLRELSSATIKKIYTFDKGLAST